MRNVIFVAPFALEATLRFVRPAAEMQGVRLALIGQEPLEKLPEELRAKLVAHQQIGDAMDVAQLESAVRQIARTMGGDVHAVIAVLEQLQVPVAEVRKRLGLGGLSVEAATNFRDKATMKTVLREHDLPCARHRLCADAQDALAFARTVGFPLVAKPPAGAGAKGTYRLDSKDQLDDYLKSSPFKNGQPILLEEFIQGEEFSFDTVTLGGRHLFHSISQYSPPPLHVLENPWIQWVVHLPRRIDGPEFEAIHRAGPRALDVLGMSTGLTHMEWFRRKDGTIAISEVAARPPGAQFTTLLSYAHDYDFYKGWVELMIFDRFTAPARKFSAGAAYLRGQGHGRVKAVHGLDRVQKEIGHLVVEARLPAMGQPPKEGSYEGEGFVIVRHPDTAVVEQALRRVIELVRVELG